MNNLWHVEFGRQQRWVWRIEAYLSRNLWFRLVFRPISNRFFETTCTPGKSHFTNCHPIPSPIPLQFFPLFSHLFPCPTSPIAISPQERHPLGPCLLAPRLGHRGGLQHRGPLWPRGALSRALGRAGAGGAQRLEQRSGVGTGHHHAEPEAERRALGVVWEMSQFFRYLIPLNTS